MNKTFRERGGVSLFIVIFTTLLVTIVTVSFTQAMIRNQQQVTTSDLSQRAYDSALAGVEDAKRVLVAQNKACAGGSTQECTKITNAIKSGKCDTVHEAGIAGEESSGNYVETTVGSESDNQAYTCVTIQSNTPEFQGYLNAGQSIVLPLKGEDKFTSIKLAWFTKDNVPSGVTAPQQPSLNPSDLPLSLPPEKTWQPAAPPIMRTQYIPSDKSSGDLDDDARTLFLYPTFGSGKASFNDDNRRDNSGAGKPSPASKCEDTFINVYGSCSVTITVPKETQSAYLQLMPLYNDTNYTVELFNGSQIVNFDGVQPKVDSTGRANDLFRRVEARIKVGGVALPYPNASINTKGNLCKSFSLDDGKNPYDSDHAGECEPALNSN